MGSLDLTMGVAGLANAIACAISDNDDLGLLGAVFTQLGDTLTTISLKRTLCESKSGDASAAASAGAQQKGKD